MSAQALSQVTKVTGVSVSEIPCWPAQDHQVKLSAAWLLERAGFERGYGMGPVGISARHTLALVNRGGAVASDIVALRDRIIRTVHDRFGILLLQEPVSVGPFTETYAVIPDAEPNT